MPTQIIMVCSRKDALLHMKLADGVAINAEMIFGSGIGPIFLNNVSCGGDETSLDDCIHSAVGVHNCDHSEDAGVICSQQGSQMEL